MTLPDLPYTRWRDSLHTLHRFLQIVGKVRLAASARRNHWWNIPFHVTGSGLTTRPMGDSPIFTIDFNFITHRLEFVTDAGVGHSFSLTDLSVADFYRKVLAGLDAIGADVQIAKPYPFDLPDADRPFAEDTEHASYDPAAVGDAWRILTRINLILEQFSGDYSGKTSPVHMFWHSGDLAVTRFSDRRIPMPGTVDLVTREAYSREVISFGFWFGDDSFPEPALYGYAAPEPEGLSETPLSPAGARWHVKGSGHLAVLPYAELRTADDPTAMALEFLESVYQQSSKLLGWDADALACPDGVTDPYLRGES